MKMEKNSLIIIVVALIAVIAVGGGITGAFVNVPVTVMQDCTQNEVRPETVCEQVPYQCTKSCQKDRLVEEQIPLSYSTERVWVDNVCIFATCFKAYAQIKNEDNEAGGTFSVLFTIRRNDGSVITQNKAMRIPPGESKIFSTDEYHFSFPASQVAVQVTPPTKRKVTSETYTTTCPDVCYRRECRNEPHNVPVPGKCPVTIEKNLWRVLLGKI